MKQSCLNIAIYLPVGSNQLARRMVDACPYHESHLLPICRARVSRSIFDVPVSSKRTRLSYVHRLCALCSMEKDNDLEPWEPVVAKCVSSPSEMTKSFMEMAVLKQLLSEGKCVLVHNESVAYDRNCIPSVANENVEGIIESCNVSGLWDRFDPDIDWACKHYTTQFKQFANVFCFICNPDLVSHTSELLIDTCNVTGYWKRNDTKIEQGCLHHNSESRFQPFKNVFCYMCNIWDNGVTMFQSIHELPPIQSDSIEIQFGELNFGRVYPQNKAVDDFRQECVQGCLRNHKDGTYNYKVCTDCQCHAMKVCEKNHERKGFFCLPDTFKSNYDQQNFYLVLGVCLLGNTSNELKQKCEDPDKDNIIDNLPASLLNDAILFRNYYCAKCNGYNAIIFLNIEIYCGIYIDARLTQSLEHLIQLSVQNSCTIKYVKRDCKNVNVIMPVSTPAYPSISTCNTTGQWESEGGSHDILYACEQDLKIVAEKLVFRSLPTLDKPFQEFKNIYCYVCNPYKSYPLYTKCNISEQWETYDDQVKNDCENGQREPKWGPFKNINCFKCNNRGDTLKQVYIVKDVISIIVHDSYRYIFKVSPKMFGELDRINGDPKGVRQKPETTKVSSRHITQYYVNNVELELVLLACIHTFIFRDSVQFFQYCILS
ncbi:hypothetical protein CHS0354_007447 [Potamilus streckersoni]|uniref:Uncharacterized protein n=1 Tax=Potamilus streckersoni TaxID=2493646 RepID=A0AAE0SVS9_9BIVA|nr:hypothetical protein CHS0354_007447 [Potamilus streckersoni]